MSKTGGPIAKLRDKEKRRVVRKNHGTFQPVMARSKSTFADKKVAFEAHRRLIQVHAINPGCRITTINKDGDTAVTFRGDGLPQEGYDLFGPGLSGEVVEIKSSNGPMVKSAKPAAVVVLPPQVKVWSRRNGFAGK